MKFADAPKDEEAQKKGRLLAGQMPVLASNLLKINTYDDAQLKELLEFLSKNQDIYSTKYLNFGGGQYVIFSPPEIIEPINAQGLMREKFANSKDGKITQVMEAIGKRIALYCDGRKENVREISISIKIPRESRENEENEKIRKKLEAEMEKHLPKGMKYAISVEFDYMDFAKLSEYANEGNWKEVQKGIAAGNCKDSGGKDIIYSRLFSEEEISGLLDAREFGEFKKACEKISENDAATGQKIIYFENQQSNEKIISLYDNLRKIEINVAMKEGEKSGDVFGKCKMLSGKEVMVELPSGAREEKKFEYAQYGSGEQARRLFVITPPGRYEQASLYDLLNEKGKSARIYEKGTGPQSGAIMVRLDNKQEIISGFDEKHEKLDALFLFDDSYQITEQYMPKIEGNVKDIGEKLNSWGSNIKIEKMPGKNDPLNYQNYFAGLGLRIQRYESGIGKKPEEIGLKNLCIVGDMAITDRNDVISPNLAEEIEKMLEKNGMKLFYFVFAPEKPNAFGKETKGEKQFELLMKAIGAQKYSQEGECLVARTGLGAVIWYRGEVDTEERAQEAKEIILNEILKEKKQK